MDFSIVIPCYNEEANLKNLVNRIIPLQEKFSLEFVLVENGSKDNSKEIFKNEIENKYENLKVVYVPENQGYGYGILQGVKAAIGKYIGWMHADLQVNPQLLVQFFEAAEKESDKVFYKGKRSNRHGIEYFFSYGMGIYESILFGKKMREVMAMPVLFNKELLMDNMEKAPFDFSLDIYVYVMANENGYKVVHLPVRMQDREAGESSWNTGLMSRIKTSQRMMDGSKKIKKMLKQVK